MRLPTLHSTHYSLNTALPMTDTSTLQLDSVRRCMLLEPIAGDLDVLVTAEPVNRCMIVARAIHGASQESEAVRGEGQASAILDAMRREAMRRTTGEQDASPPLTVPVVVASRKERARV